MNKTEYIDEVFTRVFKKDIYISEKDLEAIYDTFLEVLMQNLKKGETVSLRGFGKFYTHNDSVRSGMNPRTGEKISIPARVSPKFVDGKGFKNYFK